jgi:hypothetical protein
MERTVKCILVLAVVFASWAGGALYGQVKAVVSGLSPDSAAVVQARADHFVTHHWEGVDLSGFKSLDIDSEPEPRGNAFRLENHLAAYFWVLRMASDSVADVSVKNLMDSVANVCGKGEYPTGYDKLLAAAEKYFYSLQSPYYCEEMLLPFLDHKIARSDIPEIEKSREKFLAFMIRRNSVGHVAENFEYITLKGEVCHLWDRFSEYRISITKPACNGNGDGEEYKVEKVHFPPIMVVFFTADCRDCREGIVSLSYSAIVRSLVKEKKLRVMAICTEGNLSSVSTIIPKDWIAGSDGGYIARNRLYSIRHTPSVYYMDKEGTVLLRDASVSSAIQFLLEQ